MKKLTALVAMLLLLFALGCAQADAWFPELTVEAPTELQTTLEAMGIDYTGMISQVPETCDVTVDGYFPQYPDHEYISVSLRPDSTGVFIDMVLTDGVWYLPEGALTVSEIASGYTVHFNMGDDYFEYDGLARLYKVGVDGNRFVYDVDDSYALTMTVDGQGITARYGLNGVLLYYSIPSGDEDGCRVFYQLDNQVDRAQLTVDGAAYIWYAGSGWYRVDSATNEEIACSAPAGYENYDAAAFMERCPSPAAVLPQPAYGLTQDATISGPLCNELADMDVPMYARDEAEALGSGVIAANGMVYVEDREYDKVTLCIRCTSRTATGMPKARSLRRLRWKNTAIPCGPKETASMVRRSCATRRAAVTATMCMTSRATATSGSKRDITSFTRTKTERWSRRNIEILMVA